MEPLWSPVVATGGNQWQKRSARKPRKQANSVAAGCRGLPETLHGKEGVNGSSPSEGFHKKPANGSFLASAAYAHRSIVPEPDLDAERTDLSAAQICLHLRQSATSPRGRVKAADLCPVIFSSRRSVRQLRGPPFGRDDPHREIERAPIERLRELRDRYKIVA